ncbi:MAG: hypothetical protein NC124_02225 [Clostridium sp.]|nr:hypothetical protein [Clostridium sp.]
MTLEEIRKKAEEIEKAVEEYNGRKIYRDEKTGRFAASPYKSSKDDGANLGARNTRYAAIPVTYYNNGKITRRIRFART